MTATDRDPLLHDLTEPQREAVQHGQGPLLILAAAGSGKTRVISRRIVRLMERGVRPWQVLALTFTNKAAGEMRQRVEQLLTARGGASERVVRALTVTTFHALCARLLRRHAERAALPGLRPDSSLYDTADQQALVKRVIAALNLSTSNWAPRTVLSVISNAKNDLLDAGGTLGPGLTSGAARRVDLAPRVERLHQANAVDFDDLFCYRPDARERTEIRAECQTAGRYLAHRRVPGHQPSPVPDRAARRRGVEACGSCRGWLNICAGRS